tara:strand:- start:1443 stop:2375 length:933 start_codon:yes stop_codon:yes gene_type:complete
MDPLTLAVATFGIQKLRGKSTKRALRDAAFIAGGTQLLGSTSFGQNLGIRGFGGAGGIGSFGETGIGRLLGVAPKGYEFGEVTAEGLPQINKATGNIVGTKQQVANLTGMNQGTIPSGLKKLIPESTGGKIALASAAVPLLMGGDEEVEMPPGTRPEDYEKAMAEARQQISGVGDRAPAASTPLYSNQNIYQYNQGGIVSALPKYNTGGINYLPSKVSHDENDANNYVRASGYVEDGSGNGNKDEDTMLAQLADGEFVSRADAILGAGILEGASPKDMKDMRKKGAAFFYDQQAKFKRVYDILNASRKDN